MLDFKDLNISDKLWVDELLKIPDFRGTEYCFTSLFIWDQVYCSKTTRHKDFFLLRSMNDTRASYLYPAGKGDLKEVIELMIDDAHSLNKNFSIMSIPSSEVSKIEELFSGRFVIKANRNSADYIYLRENLANLTGKKYQSKRNHIARFRELPDWQYEVIETSAQLDDCLKMSHKWCLQNGCYDDDSLQKENCAVQKAVMNFHDLNLRGGLLRLNGEVVAFTLGEPLNTDTFIVHIEKAYHDIRGAYPLINQEFVLHETEGFTYINREDDAGDEGLRKAKLSYNPEIIYEKYYAIEK